MISLPSSSIRVTLLNCLGALPIWEIVAIYISSGFAASISGDPDPLGSDEVFAEPSGLGSTFGSPDLLI